MLRLIYRLNIVRRNKVTLIIISDKCIFDKIQYSRVAVNVDWLSYASISSSLCVHHQWLSAIRQCIMP